MPDHFSAWEEYQPDQRVGSLYGHAGNYADMSFAEALGNQTSGEDVRLTLLREAVTAALNAANDSVAFPFARYDDGVRWPAAARAHHKPSLYIRNRRGDRSIHQRSIAGQRSGVSALG